MSLWPRTQVGHSDSREGVNLFVESRSRDYRANTGVLSPALRAFVPNFVVSSRACAPGLPYVAHVAGFRPDFATLPDAREYGFYVRKTKRSALEAAGRKHAADDFGRGYVTAEGSADLHAVNQGPHGLEHFLCYLDAFTAGGVG